MSNSYRSKPSEIWSSNLEQLANVTFLLVCRHGPSVFSVKSAATGEVNKVTLGNPHKCTCKQEFCLHSLFCLTKVLKLPQTHPFCYQVGLTDNEMTQVLDGICTAQPKRMSTKEAMRPSPVTTLQTAANAVSEADPGSVPRIAVEPGDSCPICYNDMEVDMLGLTWCRSGCGRSIHGECMIGFIDYQISHSKPINCPFCRETDWSIMTIKRDIKAGKAAQRKKSKNSDKEPIMTLPIQCSSCKCMLRSGVFFRCLECSHHLKKAPTAVTSNSLLTAALNQKLPQDFCMQCFTNISNNIHLRHHFVSSDTAIQDIEDVTWSVAKHPQTGGQAEDSEARNAAREQILSTIRNRELTMDDYEMLLALDAAPVQASLASVCIASLPMYNHSEMSSQGVGSKLLCWCCDRRSTVHVNATTELYANIRVLPCGHLAHEKCMNGELEIFLSNEEVVNIMCDYRCSHIDCGAVVFPGLRRHKKKKRTSSESAAAAAAEPPGEKATPSDPTLVARHVTGINGSSLTFGLVGSALGATGSGSNGNTLNATTAGAASAIVRPRRPSVERGNVEGPIITQISNRTNGGLQDMFVGTGAAGVNSEGSGTSLRSNRSASPSSGGLVLGSTSRRMNQNGLDGGGSIIGRMSASDVSRHAANTDMSAAVVLTSRSFHSSDNRGSGDVVTVRNRRASSEGIDPLVYRTVNNDYNTPLSTSGAADPVSTVRMKRPPRKKPEHRSPAAMAAAADLSFAESLLTVNPITTGQQQQSQNQASATAYSYSGMSTDDGSVVAAGGVVSALAPPQPPVPRDPSVSAKNKVSAILSRRLRNSETSNGASGAAAGEAEVPSFENFAITNSSTAHVRSDSNGSSAVVPPRRSPLVVLPSTNSGRLAGSGSAVANVVTDEEAIGGETRHVRSGSAVEGLTEPDVLSNLLSINSTASLTHSGSTSNLQPSGSTGSLTRFNEMRTRKPPKGKLVKGFSLSTKVTNFNDESDGEA